ncbi:hypothetical protein F511_40149 [Dorcoceras hygrometricum]|uniref:Protein LTV1 n=1 Tax=Dorcoceras hygrometricum TaxID=472368 RepID=A0A2Z7A1W5_9LAMI|nr:hypothetical protein F511_40149 [Dorcoceras hygrometricum]
MGKKKRFIDKKKSATFQLLSRDTSDPNYSSDPSSERVFIRVDNNGGVNPDSIFADALEDCDGNFDSRESSKYKDQNTALPDHVRKEILELGFPDDGYDYLIHMREIKNKGGGSNYYDNPKASFLQLERDVKAYDSSRVEVRKLNDVSVEKSIYSVAAKTFGVRLQKVVDADVAAMLDDSDSSKFGSDVEDLEEDFVVRANLIEGAGDDDIDAQLNLAGGLMAVNGDFSVPENVDAKLDIPDEKARVRRPLDEQFDLLELQEYASDIEEHSDYLDEEEESLAEKLNLAFKGHRSDLLHRGMETDVVESHESTADVIRRCKEFAIEYEEENENEEEIFVESSDESEVWDCETIISTYSTLDNHPGKIGAPETRRKKRLAEAIFGSSDAPNQVIVLKGKEKIPVDFLPHSSKHVEQKLNDEKDANSNKAALQKRKPHGQESKEEKKERKAAVKLGRREARQRRKEMKDLYKSEAQNAQKVAAFAGPSSIHLM